MASWHQPQGHEHGTAEKQLLLCCGRGCSYPLWSDVAVRQRSCGNHQDLVRAPQNPAHGNTDSPPRLQARSQHPPTHTPCPALPSCRGKPQAHVEHPLLPLEMDPATGSSFKPRGERQPPAMGPGQRDSQAAAPPSCPIHPSLAPTIPCLSHPIPSLPSHPFPAAASPWRRSPRRCEPTVQRNVAVPGLVVY